jgi:aminoglycoside phosphotransferase (APT) family kinase protein
VTAVDIDTALVRALLAEQFPQWAGLPITPLGEGNSDNVIFRLGSDLVVRLPRPNRARFQVLKEHRWLPVLAPQLPLAVPQPVALGEPSSAYDRHWSVYRWLDGHIAELHAPADPHVAARELARFVAALEAIDTTDGPEPGPQNFFRGGLLTVEDAHIRGTIAALDGLVDTAGLRRAWETALAAPAWHKPPVWIHGDLHGGNLLTADGRLSAVIDFGGLGVGDPACDLMVAWLFLSAESRPTFRDELQVDDATWARGRGWGMILSLPSPDDLAADERYANHFRHWVDELIADLD